MGIFEKLFGTNSSKATQTTTNTVDVPGWIQTPQQTIASKTSELLGKEYTPYTGQRVAQLSADETDAYNRLRSSLGLADPYFAGAQDTLGQVSQIGLNGFSQEQLDPWMNPYTQNVLDIQKSRALDAYGEQRQALQQRAGQTGAFGGSRHGLAEAKLSSDFQRQLGESEMLGLHQAYNQGLAGAMGGAQMAGQAGVNSAGLAMNQSQNTLSELSALEGAGANQRMIEQMGLDAQYGEHLNAQAYPWEQLSAASSILNPMASLYRETSSTTNTKDTPANGGWLGKAIGFASSIAGIAGMGIPGQSGAGMGAQASYGQALQRGFNNPGLYGPGFKEGGLVDLMQRGGQFGFDTYPQFVGGVKDTAGWIKDNPIDAATIGLSLIPGAGLLSMGAKGTVAAAPTAGRIGLAGLKGLKGAGKSLMTAKGANAASLAGLSGLQIGKLLAEGDDPSMEDMRAQYDAENEQLAAYYAQQELEAAEAEAAEPMGPKQALTAQADKVLGRTTAPTAAAGTGTQAASSADAGKEKEKDWLVSPNQLLAFGAALLSSKGDFFHGFGDASKAVLEAKQEEETLKYNRNRQHELDVMTKETAIRKEALEQAKLALDVQRAGNSAAYQQALISQMNNPYTRQKQELQLKILENRANLGSGGNYGKRLDDLTKAVLNSGRYDAMEARAQAMQMLGMGGTDGIAEESLGADFTLD